MQVRGIFFRQLLYSGQAAKCSRITPPAYGMDATKASEHEDSSLKHDGAALGHDEVVQGQGELVHVQDVKSGTCCSPFRPSSIVATFVTVTETR